MKAALKTGPEAIEIVDVPSPEPGPGEYLVRTTACGICASDIPGWRDATMREPNPGGWNANNPGLTGHEMVGVIEAAGEGSDPSRVGERVWGDYIIGCKECAYCQAGQDPYCARCRTISQGYAEFFNCPGEHLHPIDDDMTDEEAALVWDMIGTPMHAMKRVQVKEGDAVAVWGLGPVGLGMVQGARVYGAARIIGLDPLPMRRKVAEELGAHATLDPTDLDPVAQLREMFAGTGPDISGLTVGNEKVFDQAYQALRLDGRMVTVTGSPKLAGQTPKWVTGTWACFGYEFDEFLSYIRSGALQLKPLITHRFPFAEINEAFKLRAEQPEVSLKVMVNVDA